MIDDSSILSRELKFRTLKVSACTRRHEMEQELCHVTYEYREKVALRCTIPVKSMRRIFRLRDVIQARIIQLFKPLSSSAERYAIGCYVLWTTIVPTAKPAPRPGNPDWTPFWELPATTDDYRLCPEHVRKGLLWLSAPMPRRPKTASTNYRRRSQGELVATIFLLSTTVVVVQVC